MHFYDDYADSYKNHQVKAALEVNAPAQPLTFVVSTDPDSQKGHPGYDVGARESMKFYVIIKAKIKWQGEPPFKTIRFLVKRDKTGEGGPKTGYLVTDPNDPDGPKDVGSGMKEWTFRTHRTAQDKGVTDWIITDKKGRWKIKVFPPHESNTVKFKIDKRKQIVIVANSWVGATRGDLEGLCWTLSHKVYKHVGFSLPDSSSQCYSTVTDTSRVKGRLIFYSFKLPFDPAHVAIQVDISSVVDINCAGPTVHKDPSGNPVLDVRKHAPPESYADTPYAAWEYKSTQELIDLDGE